MASSVKRERSLAYEKPSPGKKPRLDHNHQSLLGSPLPLVTNHRVLLNPADCDLDFNIEKDGRQGSALYEHGFAYCWSGARATIGVTGGKYCFSCKVVSAQPVDMDDTPLEQRHLCRVGVSRGDDKVGNLGETEHSFGFGGTGKFSNFGKFVPYGEKFNVGDTILCAVDLESKPMGSISFAKNGKWLGTAVCFNVGSNGLGVGLFPHVLLKNVVVELQFSYEDGLFPQDGYRPWAYAVEDAKCLMGPSFSNVHNCELIMMVGLPASGKTTWAEKWVNEHPEKRYILLGTNLALDQMKVPGLLRKQNYGERFDRLMDRATAIFNTLLSRASKTPRNFIIDQTNVYKSARKRKLKPFVNYQKIAVVAFPRPEDLKIRSEKRFREMGKEVPAEAVNEMLANFVLPKSKDMPGADEYFDQVIYIELNMTESKRCLDEMKANMQSCISASPYSCESSLHSSSSKTMRYSHNQTLEYPRESCVPFNHSNLGHYGQQGNSLPPYDNPALQHQVTPSGGHWQGSYPSQPMLSNMHVKDPSVEKFLPRDDFNHHRSYSGYEHRATAPVGYYHMSASETMDLSPRYNHNGPTDMHALTSRFLPASSIPHGSTQGTLDPRNSYGNHATNVPNYGGYQPPSRYY